MSKVRTRLSLLSETEKIIQVEPNLSMDSIVIEIADCSAAGRNITIALNREESTKLVSFIKTQIEECFD